MADFYSVVHRLDWILDRAEEYLTEKGGDCSGAHTMLADLTGTGLSRKITLDSRNTAKLTAAQLAIATEKGWVLS